MKKTNNHTPMFSSIETFLSKVTDLNEVSMKDVKANLKTQGLYDRTNQTQQEYIKQTTIELWKIEVIKADAASKNSKETQPSLYSF